MHPGHSDLPSFCHEDDCTINLIQRSGSTLATAVVRQRLLTGESWTSAATLKN